MIIIATPSPRSIPSIDGEFYQVEKKPNSRWVLEGQWNRYYRVADGLGPNSRVMKETEEGKEEEEEEEKMVAPPMVFQDVAQTDRHTLADDELDQLTRRMEGKARLGRPGEYEP
jgi:hypothetical protein